MEPHLTYSPPPPFLQPRRRGSPRLARPQPAEVALAETEEPRHRDADRAARRAGIVDTVDQRTALAGGRVVQRHGDGPALQPVRQRSAQREKIVNPRGKNGVLVGG